ncbi:MAG: hypothetical protein LQ340_004171 [Diploschistes diacapsis]|nr:MAG: hypothetical protein LQ340_004171 [Diploschistes diacapsis]
MSAERRDRDVDSVLESSKRRKLRTGSKHATSNAIELSTAGVQKLYSRDDYTVGWICALALEMTAAKAMLEELHPDLESQVYDSNAYTYGSISGHNVVITCLPSGVYGTTSAATVATKMLSSFDAIQIRMMIGIGGGVPSLDADIRLADVVVSNPTPNCTAVVQYDHGKTTKDGRLQRTSSLNKPPQLLRSAVSNLRSDHDLMGSQISAILTEVRSKWPRLAASYAYPG